MVDPFYCFCAPATGLVVASSVAAGVRSRFGLVVTALLGFVSGGAAWFIAGMLVVSTLR